MPKIEWQEDFATGINVIDSQHKRIIHYINQLDDARNLDEPGIIDDVLINLVDYTLSHFAFEESLMEDAGYDASDIHIQTHNAFRSKIEDYSQRHKDGEDVADELNQLLNVWLINHIAEDDSSYAPVVKANMPGINKDENSGWIKQRVKRFFG
jgi:hemerythrin